MATDEELLGQIEALLDRQTAIESLAPLERAVLTSAPPELSHRAGVAIGLDTSVLLRLADRESAEVVDYLTTQHAGPLILPGQAIQEFWNNSLAVIETPGEAMRRKFTALADEVANLGLGFQSYAERFRAVLADFTREHEFIFESATEARLRAVLEALTRKAAVPYVPRNRFYATALSRDQTRTPPGFRDAGQHGDFYLWADFLLGLLRSSNAGNAFELVVIATADTKPDWSRGGRAHPVLVAEVRSLVGASFETWDLGRLKRFVSERTSTGQPAGD